MVDLGPSHDENLRLEGGLIWPWSISWRSTIVAIKYESTEIPQLCCGWLNTELGWKSTVGRHSDLLPIRSARTRSTEGWNKNLDRDMRHRILQSIPPEEISETRTKAKMIYGTEITSQKDDPRLDYGEMVCGGRMPWLQIPGKKSKVWYIPRRGVGGITEDPTGGRGKTRSTPIARLWVAGIPRQDENPQLEGGEMSYRSGTRRREKLIPE